MLALAALFPAPAVAHRSGGGSDILSAPQLPIGQNVVGGGTSGSYGSYAEFWRITAVASDALTVDFGSTNGQGVHLCILAPRVTDYTLDTSSCNTASDTRSKSELRFTLPSAGTWTLKVQSDGDGNDSDGRAPTLAYQLTGYVRHYTHTTISAPMVVKKRSRVTYNGTVSGATGGQVKLQSRSLAHPAWKTFALAAIRANGAFTYKTRVAEPGTYRIKAVYPGDTSHLASSSIVSFKVV